MRDEQEIMRRLDDIYFEVESVRRMHELDLHARKDELEPTIMAIFAGKDGEALRKCHLATDGVKTQQ